LCDQKEAGGTGYGAFPPSAWPLSVVQAHRSDSRFHDLHLGQRQHQPQQQRRGRLPEDLPFGVIRITSEDEVLARATNLLIGRATYETAISL
jgi:hypothetical protein